MICLHLRLAFCRVDARSCVRPRKLRDGRLSPASYSISKQLDRARRRGSQVHQVQARQEPLPKTSPTLNNQVFACNDAGGEVESPAAELSCRETDKCWSKWAGKCGKGVGHHKTGVVGSWHVKCKQERVKAGWPGCLRPCDSMPSST